MPNLERAVIDVVNFNADGSCLPAHVWIQALQGGEGSQICAWLRAFVELERKVTLGFVGATIADMVALNPEAVDIINSNPGVFEVILRPFAHDIGLLRTPEGFRVNFGLGREIITSVFERVTPYYLPPEFMLTNEQVTLLGASGVAGVFINAVRFSAGVRDRIPDRPYLIQGLFGAKLGCVPVVGRLTSAYLLSIQLWDSVHWNEAILSGDSGTIVSWRDGESWLLLPDGLSRERRWLENESHAVRREFLEDAFVSSGFSDEEAGDGAWKAYPVHSFSDWVKEFRMLGFLRRLHDAEAQIAQASRVKQALWLQAINSDVLSAVEKEAPVLRLRALAESDRDSAEDRQHTIHRSARGQEGEEFLALLERYDQSAEAREYVRQGEGAHMIKLRSRVGWLEGDGSTS